MKRALIVEDDAVYRAALGRALRRSGYETVEAAGVEEVFALLERETPTHAVVDLALLDGSGIDVVREIVGAAPACRVVLLTAHGTIPATVEAMRAGALDVLSKPVSTDALVAALEQTAPARPATDAWDQAEADHIQRVLLQCDGNLSEAARRLRMHRRTLQRKLQKAPLTDIRTG